MNAAATAMAAPTAYPGGIASGGYADNDNSLYSASSSAAVARQQANRTSAAAAMYMLPTATAVYHQS